MAGQGCRGVPKYTRLAHDDSIGLLDELEERGVVGGVAAVENAEASAARVVS